MVYLSILCNLMCWGRVNIQLFVQSYGYHVPKGFGDCCSGFKDLSKMEWGFKCLSVFSLRYITYIVHFHVLLSLTSTCYLAFILNLCKNITYYKFLLRYVLTVLRLLICMCDMGSNDVYDFDTGADVNKKESVVNIVGR